MIIRKLIAGRGYNEIMIKEIKAEEKRKMNLVARHPLQSYEWGEFRRSERVEVLRFGEYKGNELKEVYQISLHQIPKLPWKIGYCPKSNIPSKEVMRKITEMVKKKGVIMVKFEPNVRKEEGEGKIKKWKNEHPVTKGEPLFTNYTFWLDLKKSEEELMAEMKSKTRYNVRLAERKGVKVIEDNSKEGFEEYWKLMSETTKRQEFYAHNRSYHEKMWEIMRKAGQAHLFKAVLGDEVLTTWVVLKLNKILYYPYGASSREHRELMSNNLIMWEVIKFGKREGCVLFDMWGSLGPEPDKRDPWYGFHRFKEGYGAKVVEFVGSWDLMIKPVLYWIYRGGNKLRWGLLRLKKKLG